MCVLSRRDTFMICIAGTAAGPSHATAAQPNPKQPPVPVDRGAVDRILAEWPGRPKLGAYRLIDKFGLPQEATPHKLTWHNNGPWKKTVVTRKEIPHDFPKIHMDYVQQTIDYKVTADVADELTAFDGSVTLDRTAGEISSRCNMEEANLLTINLVHDILTKKKTVAEARKAFGDNEVEFALGNDPAYMKAIQFEVPKKMVADPDVPVIAGTARRAAGEAPKDGAAMADAEILAFLLANDEGEIDAAGDAGKKKIAAPVQKFARMLHEEHGKHLDATTKLAQKLMITPLETAAVDKARVEGAGQLAELVRLPADAFAAGYVALMVKGHGKTLEMIDNQFLKAAKNEELKKHLQATRGAVAAHLEEAKKLQGAPKR